MARSHNTELSRYHSVLLELSQTDYPEQASAFQRVTEAAARALDVERVSIWLFNDSNDQIVCEDLFIKNEGRHETGSRIKMAQYPEYFKNLLQSRIISAPDVRDDKRTSEFTDSYLKPLNIYSMLDVPVRFGGKTHGIVCHESVGRRREWSTDEQEFCLFIADFVALCFEFGKRRQAQNMLSETEQRFLTLTETSPIGIFIIQKENFIFANSAAEKITGFSKEELLKMMFWERVHPDFVEAIKERGFKRLRHEEFSPDFEFKIIHKTGRERWVMSSSQTTVFHGEPAIVATFIDITERKSNEDALRESEKRYRGLVESQNDMVVRVDTEGRFLFVNDAYCRTFGKRREELLGRTFMTLVHPDDLENTLNAMKGLDTPPYRVYLEQRAHTAGGVRWIGWEDYAIKDSDGKTIEIQAVGRDVTDRKLNEIALQESEERYKRITSTITDYIYTVWFKNGIPFETVHRPSCKVITGYTPEEFQTEPFLWIKMVHEEDREMVLSRTATIISEKKSAPIEHRIIRKDGTVRWIRNTPVIHFDTNGLIESYDGIIQDITERKTAETALRESEERFRIAAGSASDLIYEWDLKTNNINWYGDIDARLGCTDKKVPRNFSAWKLMTHPDDYDRVITAKTTCIMERGSFSDVYRVIECHGGTRHWAERSAIIFDDNNQPVKFIGVITDITAQRQAEENMETLNKRLMQSNRRLNKLALVDTLTGLYNHRYFEEIIDPEFERARRNAHPLSLILIDIDYFKSINEIYSHQFGDLILKQFSRHLRRLIRHYDIVIRYGGEEFLLVSPGLNREGALNFAHRILSSTSVTEFGDKNARIKLKLSLSIASYPEDNVFKGNDLITLAEGILSKVKDNGGNAAMTSLDHGKPDQTGTDPAEKQTDVIALKQKISKLTKRANQSLVESIFALAKTIEVKDHYTGEHVEKTLLVAEEIAKALAIPDEEIERIRQAAILHDIGKIGISEKILLKTSKLSRQEYAEIKKHPLIGAEIVRPIQYLQNVIPLFYYHHERWDGKGYPIGLKGEDIPLGARIVALADVYQALSSDRPYRKAYSDEQVLKIIKSSAGTQFDPRIVNIFFKIFEQLSEKSKG